MTRIEVPTRSVHVVLELVGVGVDGRPDGVEQQGHEPAEEDQEKGRGRLLLLLARAAGLAGLAACFW